MTFSNKLIFIVCLSYKSPILAVGHFYARFFERGTFMSMKLLIIEDEPALRESMQTYLEQQGFVCEAVSEFRAGLQKVRQYNYDCVVIDINLPYGSGLDIVRELKAIEAKAGIIITSARTSLEDKL